MAWPRKRTPTSVLDPFVKKPISPSSPGVLEPWNWDPSMVPNKNMGKVQKAGPEWPDFGDDDSKNRLRPNEQADRKEREAYGQPLPAAYRYLIGLTPKLLAADRVGARAYLDKVEHAMDVGGWTRSEWMRLRKMRAKWRARASGNDPRFEQAGNRSGGLDQYETAAVKQAKIVAEMQGILAKSGRSSGD